MGVGSAVQEASVSRRAEPHGSVLSSVRKPRGYPQDPKSRHADHKVFSGAVSESPLLGDQSLPSHRLLQSPLRSGRKYPGSHSCCLLMLALPKSKHC